MRDAVETLRSTQAISWYSEHMYMLMYSLTAWASAALTHKRHPVLICTCHARFMKPLLNITVALKIFSLCCSPHPHLVCSGRVAILMLPICALHSHVKSCRSLPPSRCAHTFTLLDILYRTSVYLHVWRCTSRKSSTSGDQLACKNVTAPQKHLLLDVWTVHQPCICRFGPESVTGWIIIMRLCTTKNSSQGWAHNPLRNSCATGWCHKLSLVNVEG